MEQVCDLYRVLGDSLDLEETLATFDHTLRPLLPYQALSVHLAEGRRLVPAYAAGTEFAALSALEVAVGQGFLGRAASTRQPLLNCRPELAGLATALVAPLEQGGAVTAVLALYQDGSRLFTEADLRLLLAVAPKLARVIENTRACRSIAKLAGIDPATGVLNARAMFQRMDAELARTRRYGERLCVAQCAIEGLREAPLDLAGAVRGRVAASLRESCREYDAVASTANDFVLILPGFAPADWEEKCARLQQAVEEIGLAAGLQLAVRAGAAFFPGDALDAEDLLAGAAQRLHQARHEAAVIENGGQRP